MSVAFRMLSLAVRLCQYHQQVSDELIFSGSPWSSGGNGDFERTGGPLSQVESGRSAQRSIRPSAFPSSLTWDSDSEKETLDGSYHTCLLLSLV